MLFVFAYRPLLSIILPYRWSCPFFSISTIQKLRLRFDKTRLSTTVGLNNCRALILITTVLKSVSWNSSAAVFHVTDVAEWVSEPGRGDGESDDQVHRQTTQRTYLSTLHLRSHTVLHATEKDNIWLYPVRIRIRRRRRRRFICHSITKMATC